ncbi:quinone oxidoreductase-like protein 2 [Biomphalaria pfeifferi]|uniref:Quinone oxidoreductase-like protein 2 n=1 Tax=Biomphalaria pfeifferi TaxID=112525 RepID=A0AAD8BBX9_BIOPF|nr:quinone oxidoreductase-like protein 2 [Biomphalaria pfeifferi]
MAFIIPPEILLKQSLRLCTMFGHGVKLSTVSSTPMYRAAVCTKLAEPLVVREFPVPATLKETEVLVATHACGVNFADILTCKGLYQERRRTPFTPGGEIAGKVLAVGSKVHGIKSGDRVFVLAFGKTSGGAAEICLADMASVFPVPDNLNLVEAASLIVSYSTSLMALTMKANLKKGETVLITAAAGATGLAAVFAVCGGEEKCQFLQSRGADKTIDYTKDRIVDKVKEFTNGRGVDVVMDQVGGDSLLDCIKSLAFEGRALTIGYASGSIPKIPANQLLLKSSSLIGVFWGSYAQSNPSAFRKTFSLDELNEAYQYVLDRKSVGKVVIKMKDEDLRSKL